MRKGSNLSRLVANSVHPEHIKKDPRVSLTVIDDADF
jgi:hypothetical protein